MDDYKSSIEHLENPTDFNILVNTPHHYFICILHTKKDNNKKKKEEMGYQRDKLQNSGSIIFSKKKLGINLQIFKKIRR